MTFLLSTNLDTTARVNGKHIDLFKLFDVVASRGGYDVVSSEKLAWRKVGQEFNLGQTNTAAYAFALKTVYYKNLACVTLPVPNTQVPKNFSAFEIKTIHHKEPPPKEILENISAKGGDLLSRTMDNFRPPQSREQQANGHESDGSGDEEHKTTPKQERMDLDEPGSGGGRTTRGIITQSQSRTSREKKSGSDARFKLQACVKHHLSAFCSNPMYLLPVRLDIRPTIYNLHSLLLGP